MDKYYEVDGKCYYLIEDKLPSGPLTIRVNESISITDRRYKNYVFCVEDLPIKDNIILHDGNEKIQVVHPYFGTLVGLVDRFRYEIDIELDLDPTTLGKQIKYPDIKLIGRYGNYSIPRNCSFHYERDFFLRRYPLKLILSTPECYLQTKFSGNLHYKSLFNYRLGGTVVREMNYFTPTGKAYIERAVGINFVRERDGISFEELKQSHKPNFFSYHGSNIVENVYPYHVWDFPDTYEEPIKPNYRRKPKNSKIRKQHKERYRRTPRIRNVEIDFDVLS